MADLLDIIYEQHQTEQYFSLLKRSTYVHEFFETIIPITIDRKKCDAVEFLAIVQTKIYIAWTTLFWYLVDKNLVKFIYSEKATKLCEISNIDLSGTT